MICEDRIRFCCRMIHPYTVLVLYMLQVQADVDTQGDFVRTLAAEVRDATFANIEDVVTFVAWLDEELSFLVSVSSTVAVGCLLYH